MFQCKKVVFSSQAYLSIIAETYSFPDIETGGLFLGKVMDNVWYVMEIIDPGYNNAVRHSAYFEYDLDYVTHLANVRHRLYQDGIDLLGSWHRHPGSFDSFSSTDDETNERFAEKHSCGAISAIINLDPDFRITMYHVGLPLKYTTINDIEIGDSYIPNDICLFKKPEGFMGNKVQIIEKEPDPGFLKRFWGFFSSKKSNKNPKIESCLNMAMEMLETELDFYIEKQVDYSYEIKAVENSIELKMTYDGKIPAYPKTINCTFFVENNQNFCEINSQKIDYKPGTIKDFIDKKIALETK